MSKDNDKKEDLPKEEQQSPDFEEILNLVEEVEVVRPSPSERKKRQRK